MSEMNNKTTCGDACGCSPDQGKYWQDVENKVLDPKALSQEFSDDEFDSFSVKKSRRSFLKIMGFSVSALPLAGCVKIPVKKALPYLRKNDVVIPGVANWFASTWEGLPVLLKTREGRPIKVEGNDKSTFTRGGASVRMQGSVLSLYDSHRLKMPMINGSEVQWEQFDKDLAQKLTAASQSGKDVYLVTRPMKSPSSLSLIEKFKRQYNAKHVAYDPTAATARIAANKRTHNAATLDEYDFTKADLVLSFGVDFLGSEKNSVAYAKQYATRRDPKAGLNKHIQIEELMTLTGSNADERFTKSVADQRNILLGILSQVSGESVSTTISGENLNLVKKLSTMLKAHQGRSLVLARENNADLQVIVNKINYALNNYGSTLQVFESAYEANADDAAFESFVRSANSGGVAAVIFADVDPVYSYHNDELLTAALKKVDTRVSLAYAADETTQLCDYVGAINHNYESWCDYQVSADEFAFSQPVIQPLVGSRMIQETLMALMGNTEETFYDVIKAYWKSNFYNKQNKFSSFEQFWNTCLHDGVFQFPGIGRTVNYVGSSISSAISSLISDAIGGEILLSTYEKVALGDGQMANNPWLHELPDPVTKATWGNYLMLSPTHAKKIGAKTGSVVQLSANGASVEIPVMVQPGMAKNTVAAAVGYGRGVGSVTRQRERFLGVGYGGGKVEKFLGSKLFDFHSFNGTVRRSALPVKITMTAKTMVIAQTQTHHSMEGRDIVREASYSEYKANPKAGNTKHVPLVNIYPEHDQSGHQWAMAIDLNKCTGCSACIVSCNSENNIPVVGKEEVAMRREMHWMRLDRYYAGDEDQPEVVHMPMPCQHCENAPCENVCPVLATMHSSDGINQQVYNRCVGTRYCANNCPYKVRRFNWFNYNHEDQMENMVLNPDVSVRSRGVMEKCSFCIQRIQEGKLTAKRERRDLRDGDIKVACQQSCPSDAVIFGDKNDPNSKIAQYIADTRNYTVLEELNVKPRVSYLTKIRNKA